MQKTFVVGPLEGKVFAAVLSIEEARARRFQDVVIEDDSHFATEAFGKFLVRVDWRVYGRIE